MCTVALMVMMMLTNTMLLLLMVAQPLITSLHLLRQLINAFKIIIPRLKLPLQCIISNTVQSMGGIIQQVKRAIVAGLMGIVVFPVPQLISGREGGHLMGWWWPSTGLWLSNRNYIIKKRYT
jgi:hypothetical protein